MAVYLREVAGLRAGRPGGGADCPTACPFPVAAFGVLKAGCVLVNVNPLYTSDEMARQFADAEPHALIIVDMFADKIPAATAGHPIPNIIGDAGGGVPCRRCRAASWGLVQSTGTGR